MLLRHETLAPWKELLPSVRARVARELLRELRDGALQGADVPAVETIARLLAERFQSLDSSRLGKVINATGIVLHTNLGRAPLGRAVLEDLAREMQGYCGLEIDRRTGGRGIRGEHCRELLKLLTGASASVLVNNNAAALFLALHRLAKGKKVVVSRGELVQIGGGFKIPEILEAAGTALKEVGTTNMTSVTDYLSVMSDPEVGMLLKVHPSNFKMVGHVRETGMAEIARVAKARGIPFIVDLGGGYLGGLPIEETTVSDCLEAGANLVAFSADKLLGGPQAGILVGDASYVASLERSPLYRALRLGKTELFLIERLLGAYLRGRRPVSHDLVASHPEDLRVRAHRLKACLTIPVEVVEMAGAVGGGTTPGEALASCGLALAPPEVESFARLLLRQNPPVVVRKDRGRVLLDLRTVFPEEEESLVVALTRSWGESCLS